MIKKCPHCEFEPITNQLICPNCGSELKENISKKIKEDQATLPPIEDVNDNINWSNYQEVSLGSVMEQFKDVIEESDEESAEKTTESTEEQQPAQQAEEQPLTQQEDSPETTDELSDNPILQAYLRRHRDGTPDAEEMLVEAIKQHEQKQLTIKEKKEAAFTVDETAMGEVDKQESAKEQGNEIAQPEERSEEQLEEQLEEQSNEETIAPIVTDATSQPENEAEAEITSPVDSEVVAPVHDSEAISEVDKAVALIQRFEENQDKTEESTVKSPSATPEERIQVEEGAAQSVSKSARLSSSSKKKIYLLTAAGLLFAAGGGWLYVDAKQKSEAAQQAQLQQTQDFAELSAELQDFYLDAQQQFIKPEKTLAQLKPLMEQMSTFKQQENYADVQAFSQVLYQKMTTLENINQYFTAPMIVGDTLDRTVHIKEMQPIDVTLPNQEGAFWDLADEAVQLGNIQLQQVQTAKDAVAEVTRLYQDGKISADLTRKTVESAQKQVNELFEISDKATLIAALEPVETALVAREKAEAEEAARLAAEKAAQEAEAARIAAEQQASANATQSQAVLSPQTPTNNQNQPIIASRQSDINDVNNAAWVWAPGVYEQFISTIISRGYVVENGFYLEPARIENGEGYYHLYATSNQSSLLSGVPSSSLPFYLVTVNAKTGFFKGNGPN